MGAISNLSTRLKERISKTIGGEACYFTAKVILTNPNTAFRLEILVMTHLYILQDFASSFMDSVKCRVQVSKDEYDQIKANAQDLECLIILTPANPTSGATNVEADRIILHYLVMMTDQADVSKVSSVGNFGGKDTDAGNLHPSQQSTRFEVELPLITKQMHNLRNSTAPITGVSGSVESFLRWACSSLGCTSVNIVKPDVNTLPNNFQLPKSIEDPRDYFDYVRKKCNIYSKGVAIYFTDDAAYIYPLWDTDPATSPQKSVINLLNGSGSIYQGLSSYHRIKSENDIDILTSGKTTYKTLNTAGAENYGTGVAIQDACSAINYNVKVKNNGEANYADSMQVITSQNKSANTSSKMQRIRYGGSTSDVYGITEKLAASNGAILTTTWDCAWPDIIKPGQSVLYHYDKNSTEYETVKGRITRVVYTSLSGGISNNRPMLKFVAQIEAFMEPETSSDMTTQNLE